MTSQLKIMLNPRNWDTIYRSTLSSLLLLLFCIPKLEWMITDWNGGRNIVSKLITCVHAIFRVLGDHCIKKLRYFNDFSSQNDLMLFFFLNRDPAMIPITSAPEAPPPRIRILDATLKEVETVRIGDRLTFRIEIPEESKSSTKNAKS